MKTSVCIDDHGRGGAGNLHRWVQRICNHRGDIIVALLKVVTYIGLTAAFFLLMSINNWQLRNPSRTLGTTIITWVAMTGAMTFVYGGYEIGRKKSKPIITNMTLGVLVTDLVTYLQLQIMNVNVNNRSHLDIFGSDFPYLLLAMLIQGLFLVAVVRFGNHSFFSIYPPKKCLLVLGSMDDKGMIIEKLNHFRLQWQVQEAVVWNTPDLRERIERAEVVFIADVPQHEAMTILQICYDLRRDVLCKAQLQDVMLSSAQQVVIDDAPFLEMDYHKMTLWQRIVKRSADIVISAFVLILLSPVMGIIAILIRREDKGPAIFRQSRMTIGGRNFTIYKFRTMKVDRGDLPQSSATEDDPRITRVGKVLRRTRLDELPQFWNILKGDMTLVGPRPEMLDNVEKYKSQMPTFVYREKVKAGLTGYAQIEGKYNTVPEDKLMLDLMYIENFSLFNDIRLLFRTLTVLFRKDSTEGFARKGTNSGETRHQSSRKKKKR